MNRIRSLSDILFDVAICATGVFLYVERCVYVTRWWFG